MRLQHYLAKAGIASRRKSEQLIADGRVSVNGEIVLSMGKTVEEDDTVCLDGKPVHLAQRLLTVLYYKPRGVVSTASDERGRKCVTDVVRDLPERLYPIGRLDMDSEGLLLLTNDGELALRMTHPRYGVQKCYVASVQGHVAGEAIERLRRGVMLDGRMTAPAKVRRIPGEGAHEKVEIIIHEGRNRQVRRMLEAVGNPVVRLVRVAVGPLTIRGLKPGQWREIRPEELETLKKALGLQRPAQEPEKISQTREKDKGKRTSVSK
jgi:23S rRNA pseudouridine2605 synthase